MLLQLGTTIFILNIIICIYYTFRTVKTCFLVDIFFFFFRYQTIKCIFLTNNHGYLTTGSRKIWTVGISNSVNELDDNVPGARTKQPFWKTVIITPDTHFYEQARGHNRPRTLLQHMVHILYRYYRGDQRRVRTD